MPNRCADGFRTTTTASRATPSKPSARCSAARTCDALPRGVIHGDMFRDNVLFSERGLTGVVDFHHAATGYWIYDLAVVANDWCNDNSGVLDSDRTLALLRAYHAIRPLTRSRSLVFPDVRLVRGDGVLAFATNGFDEARRRRADSRQQSRRVSADRRTALRALLLSGRPPAGVNSRQDLPAIDLYAIRIRSGWCGSFMKPA